MDTETEEKTTLLSAMKEKLMANLSGLSQYDGGLPG